MVTDLRYENTPLRQITGNLLRPGGPDLTLRGLDLCAFPPGARLLDLGCGLGASLSLLAGRGCSCLGLDHSLALLREASAHAPCLLADMSRLPLTGNCLDGIVCECVLSLATDKAAVLDECRRVLRPGGKMLLGDLMLRPGKRPCAGADTGADSPPEPNVPGIPCAMGALRPDALLRLLRERGFSVAQYEDHTPLLRDLAARIVWHFGSVAAFAELWHNERPPVQTPAARRSNLCAADATAPTGRDGLGYLLIIAEKTGSCSSGKRPGGLNG